MIEDLDIDEMVVQLKAQICELKNELNKDCTPEGDKYRLVNLIDHYQYIMISLALFII